jgi:hypothetical protein
LNPRGNAIAKELKVPVPVGALCHKNYKADGAARKGNLCFLASVTTLEELAGVKVRRFWWSIILLGPVVIWM